MFSSSSVHMFLSRKVAVQVLFTDIVNHDLTEDLKTRSFDVVKVLWEKIGLEVGKDLPFFRRSVDYPVLGFMGKYEVVPQQTGGIITADPAMMAISIKESDYYLIPDDFGFIQYVSRNQLRVTQIEDVGVCNDYETPHKKIMEEIQAMSAKKE